MKVLILSRFLDPESGKGLGRYSQQLAQILRSLGAEVQFSLSQGSTISSAYGSAISTFFYDIFVPLASIERISSFDIVHAAYPQISLSYPTKRSLKKFVTVHDLLFWYEHTFPKGTMNPWYLYSITCTRAACKNAIKIIAVSSLTKSDLVNFCKIHPSRIWVIPLYVDRSLSPLRTKKNTEFTIGYVGALNQRKNLDFLLMLARNLKSKDPQLNFRINIHGTGPEEKRLKLMANELRLEKVKFIGAFKDENLRKIYNSMDLFVFPSFAEGFGYPILEAEKCGVPTMILESARISPEIGAASLKVKDLSQAVDLIKKLVADEGFLAQRKRIAEQHAKSFNEENFALRMREFYEEF
jgi:glycosyltransferase involved in cell wall biosynthesis